jgi:hypothetical protein
MKRTMAVKVFDGVFVVFYGTSDPTSDEWLQYLGLVERRGFERAPQLVFTDGGAPTYFQRRYLANIMGDSVVRVAVVSGSWRVRTIVRAMSLNNGAIRAFSPAQLHDAIDYVDLHDSRLEVIESELRSFQLEVGRPVDPPVVTDDRQPLRPPLPRRRLGRRGRMCAALRRLLGRLRWRDEAAGPRSHRDAP